MKKRRKEDWEKVRRPTAQGLVFSSSPAQGRIVFRRVMLDPRPTTWVRRDTRRGSGDEKGKQYHDKSSPETTRSSLSGSLPSHPRHISISVDHAASRPQPRGATTHSQLHRHRLAIASVGRTLLHLAAQNLRSPTRYGHHLLCHPVRQSELSTITAHSD
jgi:hypothetical protein